MMRSLFTAVSGLENHQTRMDVIGNNIANVNTTGFKSGRVTFADTLSQTLSGSSSPNGTTGGVNAKQVGLGMAVSSIDTNFTHGSASSTGVNTNLAIDTDNGLFVVKNGNETYYTRNGDFTLDSNGNLTMNGNGYYVQGWNGVDGNVNASGNTQNLKIDMNSTMPAKASSTVTLSGNLSADGTAQELTGIKVSYVDGTSESVTSYTPTTKNKLILTGKSGKTYTIYNTDATLADDGTLTGTTNIVSGKTLSSISPSGSGVNITFDSTATGSKGGTVTLPTTTINETSGTYTIGKSNTINLGTITKIVTNKSGSSTDDDTLTITTAGGDYTVKNAEAGAYKVGDSFSVVATVSNSQTSQTLNGTLTYSDGTSIDSSDFSTAITGTLGGTDSTVTAITADNFTGSASLVSFYNDKAVDSTTLTMKDGTTQTGLVDESYNEGDSLYTAYTTTATIYDSLGASYSIPIRLEQTGSDTWDAIVVPGTYDGLTVSSKSTTQLTFDGSTGKNTSGSTGSITGNTYAGGATENENMSLDFSSLTQNSGESSASATSDGYTAGFYNDMSIGQDGVITVTYTNGQKQTAGQIAIATFNNPAGLETSGGSLYSQSNNSGTARVGTFTSQGVTVTPGALEMSNVDLSNELSDMIITQRGFQANSKIITVSDEMLQTLINMVQS